MAGRITHINCPSCGGTLGAPTGSRIVDCNYCGQASLVDVRDYQPSYFIAPRVREKDIRRATGRMLTDPSAPERLVREARYLSGSLYFVPFYEISGRRVGTFTTSTRKDRRVDKFSQIGTNLYVQSIFTDLRATDEYYKTSPKVDTRVIMNDLQRTVPAIDIPGWGLDQVEIETVRSKSDGVLKPFQRDRMESFGRIFNPRVSEERVIEQTLRLAATLEAKDNTRPAELRNKLIYYPLWRVRYTYKGRAYGATLDGVTGRILAARLPLSEQGRIVWMLITSGMAAFFGAKLVQLFFYLSRGLKFEEAMGALVQIGIWFSPILVFLLALMFMVMAFGWDKFRYSSELEIRGNDRRTIMINRPAKTALDRISAFLMKASEAMFRQAAKRPSLRRW